jgi:pilus assembly protein Flp/PilA
MNNITRFINDFIADESGLTAVEYAIAGGLVVGGMVTAFVTLGTNSTGQIENLGCAVEGTVDANGDCTTTTTTSNP